MYIIIRYIWEYNTLSKYLVHIYNRILKIFAVYGAAFQPVSIGIDGVERQAKELWQTSAVGYTHAHEECYAQLRAQLACFGFAELFVGQQQGVQLGDVVGVDIQRGVVEYFKETFVHGFERFARFYHLVQVFYLIGLDFSVDKAVEFFHAFDVVWAQIQYAVGVVFTA